MALGGLIPIPDHSTSLENKVVPKNVDLNFVINSQVHFLITPFIRKKLKLQYSHMLTPKRVLRAHSFLKFEKRLEKVRSEVCDLCIKLFFRTWSINLGTYNENCKDSA